MASVDCKLKLVSAKLMQSTVLLLLVMLMVAAGLLDVAAASAAPTSVAPAEQHVATAAGNSKTSGLRPDFVGTLDQKRSVAISTSLQDHLEAHGEGDLFGDSKFRCPCRNKVCSSQWRTCVCTLPDCSCWCHS